jgi:hypothetical protein
VDGQLKAYHIVDSKSNSLPKQPTTEQICKCIGTIEKLVQKYRHKEIIPTVLKWAIVAPFDFALKQYTKDMVFLRWLYPYGWTRTGKTTLGNIVLAVWNLMSDSKYKVPFTKVDTEARFGNILSRTTFPLIINEVSSLGDEKRRSLLEMFKNATETTIARGKYFQKSNYVDIPALSACVLTGNSRPPQDSGFLARIIRCVFTKDDEHTANNQ